MMNDYEKINRNARMNNESNTSYIDKHIDDLNYSYNKRYEENDYFGNNNGP